MALNVKRLVFWLTIFVLFAFVVIFWSVLKSHLLRIKPEQESTSSDSATIMYDEPRLGLHEELGAEVGAARLLTPIDQLQKRIKEGDAIAACELSVIYQDCAYVRSSIEALELHIARSASSEDQGVRDRGEEAEVLVLAGLADAAAKCESINVPSPRERIALWRMAADRGHRASMARYASGAAFPSTRTLDYLEELSAYRNDAEHFAIRAIRAGDLGMLLKLARAYSPQEQGRPNPSLLAQAVGPNTQRSLELLLLLKELTHGRLSEAEAQDITKMQMQIEALLTAQQVKDAYQSQERTRLEWFAAGLPNTTPPVSILDTRSIVRMSIDDCQ